MARTRFKTMLEATTEALRLELETKEPHLACDRGANVSPRYHVIKTPKIGDKVSQAFNGDYYPAGEITEISESLRRIKTSTGLIFWRRRQSGSWINAGTWSMVIGHRDERNPSF